MSIHNRKLEEVSGGDPRHTIRKPICVLGYEKGTMMKSPQTVLDRYIEAVQTLNKQALLDLYSPELRMFDMMAPFEFHGPGEFARRVNQWFDEVDGKEANAKATNIESKVVDGLAYMSMFMRYSDRDEHGEPRGMTNRLTWILVPAGDDWKILHEHTSVPLTESEDMAPQFEP